MNRFLPFIISLLAISCSNGERGNTSVREIVFGNGAKFEAIQTHISDVSYLPLETNDATLFSNASKVLFRDDLIYVGDSNSGKICVFDSSGKCVMVLNSIGRGPEEYVMMRSFTVDDSYIDVIDLMQLKLFRYDKRDGRFVEKIDLPVYAYDLEALGNGGFIFYYVPLLGGGKPFDQSNHRVFITDSKFNIMSRMIECTDNEFDLVGSQRYFSVNDDRIALFSFKEDGYYVFDRNDGQLLEKVHIKFSDPIPELSRQDQASLAAGYSFLVTPPVICDDYVSFMAKVGNGGGIYEYDFSSGRLFSNSEIESGSFFYNIIGSVDGFFVGFLNNAGSYYDGFIEKGFKKADPASEAAIRREDPVLVFYKLN